jgi:hypothetical protein
MIKPAMMSSEKIRAQLPTPPQLGDHGTRHRNELGVVNALRQQLTR